MSASDEFEAMVAACIANHEKITLHGSFEMQTASRMLLFALAKEIARRIKRSTTTVTPDTDLLR